MSLGVNKTLEVVIKMAFMLFKKCIFPKHSAKWEQYFNFFKLILKFHPTKLEKVFKNLNHVSLVTWAVAKKICYIFGLLEDSTTKLLLCTSFRI